MTLDSLMQQITASNSSQEREDARQRLQRWVLLHPEDDFAPDLFYLIDCMEEESCKRRAEWDALQAKLRTQGAASLTVDEVGHIGLSASSPEEIGHARQVLHEWEQAHPEARKLYEVYERFYLLEDDDRHTQAAGQPALST